MMQAIQDATLRRPKRTVIFWFLSLALIYAVIRFLTDIDDVWTEIKVTLLTGVSLAALNIGYDALSIPPRLFGDMMKEEFWREMGDQFSRLQMEGQEVLNGFSDTTPQADKETARQEWRQKVFHHCADLPASWSAQFSYQGGLQRESMMARAMASKKSIPLGTVLQKTGLTEDWEWEASFVTEIEQVKGFAKFCYDRGMELTKFKA